jgi:hypothetical protein
MLIERSGAGVQLDEHTNYDLQFFHHRRKGGVCTYYDRSAVCHGFGLSDGCFTRRQEVLDRGQHSVCGSYYRVEIENERLTGA